MKLEDIRRGCRLIGILGDTPVEILAANAIDLDVIEVIFRQPDGTPGEKVVRREDEDGISEVYTFKGNPRLFQLALEAQRIRLAPHFIPYIAMDASHIDLLPHQITAVYETMLHRHPLRFLLADDPGAGKTIMAGLLIKELLTRRKLDRCLIITPGSLAEQWQDEMRDKFGLNFEILLPQKVSAHASRNPFDGYPLVIAKLDMLARSSVLMEKLECAPPWDLVICDEAHRMSARISGGIKKTTLRFDLGEVAGRKSYHLLLMTATPHNGKEEEFQLFMGLLNEDRFGLLDEDLFDRPFRIEVDKEDPSDAVRRTIKEEMCCLNGNLLFPERKSYTVSYPLSQSESELYESVTRYVQEEMNRVKRLGNDGKLRQINVGFALQILQRRLASSPAAIHETLMRRRNRLDEQLQEEQKRRVGQEFAKNYMGPKLKKMRDDDWFYERPEEDFEEQEELFVSRATAAQTIEELRSEIALLSELENMAKRLRLSGEDSKWKELREILDDPIVFDSDCIGRRKVVIFTEARDTLQYLADRIREHVGNNLGVVIIHGKVDSVTRCSRIASFNNDPTVQIMLATDAAGEGVNLHHGAHLMVNYDLPWNPNRLEQRFGRIHRIGQTKKCHQWNLVAKDTREGAVYLTLLDKLESARKALGGKVYDVLGDMFESRPLREFMVEAIQCDDKQDVKSKLGREMESILDVQSIEEHTERFRQSRNRFDPSSIQRIHFDLERTEVTRTQSQHIRAFFMEAFSKEGGKIIQNDEHFEISNVPQCLRDFYAKSQYGIKLPTQYKRVFFDKHTSAESSVHQVLSQGHPLLDTLLDFSHDKYNSQLYSGAAFIDELNRFEQPRVMVAIRQIVCGGQSVNNYAQSIIFQKMLYVWLSKENHKIEEALMPCMLGREALDSEKEAVLKILQQEWLMTPLEKRAKDIVKNEASTELLQNVKNRQVEDIKREMNAIEKRFSNEIDYLKFCADRYEKDKLRSRSFRNRAEYLEERLKIGCKEYDKRCDIQTREEICGVAIVIPISFLPQNANLDVIDQHIILDRTVRDEIERKAMQAVVRREVEIGRIPRDVSGQNLGYDLESAHPKTKEMKCLGIMGRKVGAKNVCVTRNEIIAAHNAQDAYILAVVIIDGDKIEEQIYLQNPKNVIGPPPEFNEYFRQIPIAKIRESAIQSP